MKASRVPEVSGRVARALRGGIGVWQDLGAEIPDQYMNRRMEMFKSRPRPSMVTSREEPP